MTSERPPGPFEGEALVLWGRAGVQPVVFAAIHYAATSEGPGVELVMAAMASGRPPKMARRRLAAGGRGVDPPGTVAWVTRDRVREVHWHAGGLKIWAGIGGRPVPARVPGWLLDERTTGGRSLPTRMFLAHVEMVVPEDGQLAPFAGRRHGLLFSTARLAGDPLRLRLPLPKRVEATPELS